MSTRRQSSLLASKRIQSQLASETDTIIHTEITRIRPTTRKGSSKRVLSQDIDASDATPSPNRPAKRPRKENIRKDPKVVSDLSNRLFLGGCTGSSRTAASTCEFPLRHHGIDYHRPLLLHGEAGRKAQLALLTWYDGVSTNRSMPWRKPFIQPKDYSNPAELRQALAQRAYEVFISEIMLQQTRVQVVIQFWLNWMHKWPTIYDLAEANEDEVMSAWRGLGYYSRCKRILEACKKIVRHPDWQGLMPQDAKLLEAEIPGVGPYTAGAVVAIVYGRIAPFVDGNVLRVLSRQLGLLGDIKADKTIIGLLWACASSLVKSATFEATPEGDKTEEPLPTDIPGRWGQALMELGSTVCTPKPNCSICPITTTCRAYQEGMTLAAAEGLCHKSTTSELVDIEDLCELCEPLANIATEETAKKTSTKTSKAATLSSFFTPKTTTSSVTPGQIPQETLSFEALEVVISHARKFPLKVAKKALREQETIVCAIRCTSDGSYLLQKRPDKGK